MNLKKTLLTGSLWAIGMRWGIRALGLISLVILARLLRPEDFGLLAMAMILIGALAIFTEVGVSQMLIRDANVTRADMDTAGNIRIITGVLVAGLVAAVSSPYEESCSSYMPS